LIERLMDMRIRALLLCLVLAAASCTTAEEAATTTTGAPSTTSSTAAPASTTTTTPAPTEAETSVIVALADGIEVFTAADSVFVPGDVDAGVAAAFDDQLGGIIYQYEQTPPQFPSSAVLRLPAGRAEPEVILTADEGRSLRLLDVEEVAGRLSLLVAEAPTGGAPDVLRLADVAGGAPETVLRVDEAGEAAGVIPTGFEHASIGGNRLAVVWTFGDLEASCRFADVRDLEGNTILEAFPAPCGAGDVSHAVLSPDGARLAYLQPSRLVILDLDTGDTLGSWDAVEGTGLDFDGLTAVVTEADGYSTYSLQGVPAAKHGTDGAPELVTLARTAEPPNTSAFLGGVRPLTGPCSAAGLSPEPVAQGGLPEPVATTRAAIVATAVACEFDGLAALAAPDFTYSFGEAGSAARFWRDGEQRGAANLFELTKILDLPYTVVETGEGAVFVWPSAYAEDATDTDWEALGAVYNEEEISLFRDELGTYLGLRVGITDTGEWIYAVAGD
jgi:hypothetical protein